MLQSSEERVIEAYGLYQRNIFEHLRWLGLSPEQAKDIVQEVFLKLFEQLQNGKEVDNTKAWLMKVAKNQAYDHFKSLNYKTGMELQKLIDRKKFWLNDEDIDETIVSCRNDLSNSPEFTSIDRAGSVDLDNGIYIQECVQRQLRIFGQKYPEQEQAIADQFDGLSIQEIAKKLCRTEAATRTFIYDGKKKLKVYLEECAALLNEKGPNE